MNERLQEIASKMLEQIEIPSPYKMMLTPLMGQLTTSLAQLDEEQISELLQTVKEGVAYVEFGNSPE